MSIDLYRLLPSVYRARDVASGNPLRALLAVLGEEFELLRRDIDQMYDDWFVETCNEWVVPYIGDLLGVEGLHPGRPGVFSLRSFVANTLAYRRRKGTASVLENIAQDVSGWSVSGVEFFQLLTTTQHQEHPRLTTVWSVGPGDADRVGAVGTVDVRQLPLLARLGTAFDTASRTVDFRPFTQFVGWHNVNRLGLFLWRLRSFPMRAVPLLHVGDEIDVDSGREFQKFCLHPLGVSSPLFASPVRQPGATQRRREWEVPQRIERDAFNADVERYYGAQKSLYIEYDGEAIGADRVVAANLDWDEQPLGQLPAPDVAAGELYSFIDLERGRLVLETRGDSEPGFVDPVGLRASYHYGFSADIGGGPYARETTAAGESTQVIRVSKCGVVNTLLDALALRQGPHTVIRIMDSGTYEEFLYILLENGERVTIEAADGARPCVKGFIYVEEPSVMGSETEVSEDAPRASPIAGMTLSGLLVKGYILLEGRIQMGIDHCTLISDPEGLGSYGTIHVFSLSFFMEIAIQDSIVGALRINEGIKSLWICDSIVDVTLGLQDAASGAPTVAIGGAVEDLPGPETTIERSTIFGSAYLRAMPLASESIFTGDVHVIRKQGGCMRYCYVDASVDREEDLATLSRTPRRFRCQPDLALQEASAAGNDEAGRETLRRQLVPVFASRTYGHPSYARLANVCPDVLRSGAENGSEMGVFNHLVEPQREANMREAVRRYLPFGLEMNIIYADEETNS